MAFPSISPNEVNVRMNVPMITTRSLSGREERLAAAIPFLNIDLEFDNISSEERRQIIGHHASVGGGLSNFSFTLPDDLKDNSAGFTGTLDLTNNTSAGATSFDIDSSADGTVLKAGDYVTFANHNKIYTVTADIVSTAGSASISIHPGLTTSVPSGTVINHTNVAATVVYQEQTLDYVVDPNLFGSFTITLKEDI